jgi:hypothetical protein
VDADARIRNRRAIAVEAAIVDSEVAPLICRIGLTAKHLRQLGMTDKAIGRALGVSDKTVRNAVADGADDSGP